MAERLASIGEICAAFDVTPRSLRFHEAKALLAPLRRGQKRLHTRRCQPRPRLIPRGKGFGFSLEDIRQPLNLHDIGDQRRTRIARAHALGCDRLRAMHAQRDQLTEAIADPERQPDRGAQMLAQNGLDGAAE